MCDKNSTVKRTQREVVDRQEGTINGWPFRLSTLSLGRALPVHEAGCRSPVVQTYRLHDLRTFCLGQTPLSLVL